MPKTTVEVKLSGENGNAFAVIGAVVRGLKNGGHEDLVEEFKEEALSDDYDHLLQTCMDYVVVT